MLRQGGRIPRQSAGRGARHGFDPLERERGITILAKNTSVRWRARNQYRGHPGHAISAAKSSAFCAWSMAFCCSSMPPRGRCRRRGSVAGKALALGLKPIVLVNKIDRPDAEPMRVHDEVLELLMDLEATPEQFNFPSFIRRVAWARRRWSSTSRERR